MMKIILVAAFGLASLCHSTAFAEVLRYEGSSTVGKFVRDASGIYDKAQFKIDTVSESAGGEKCAVRGKCDLGGVARTVGSDYLAQGVQATLIGKDAIAAIVHESNPVKALSRAELSDIFTGKITNWSALGGPNLPIQALIVKKGSATRKVFRKVVLGDADYQGTTVITPDGKIVGTVARTPGAIGQISFAFLKGVRGVHALDIDGQQASVENPNYPVTRPLYLTTKGEPSGAAEAFIKWTLSAEGQSVVKQRFVGIN